MKKDTKMATINQSTEPKLTFYQILEAIEGIAIMITCYLTFFLKPLRNRWGLTKAAAKRPLVGDEIIKTPKAQFSHGVEINAPASAVWPWVAQMGQGRGGFYTYEALENLAGLNIHNADTILPAYQHPKVGDLIPFSPQDAYPLVFCEHGKAMVLGVWFDIDKGIVFNPEVFAPANCFRVSWLWYVEDLGDKRSRLISRNRLTYTASFKNKLLFGWLMEPVVFAMDRKMCLGIKKRAERFHHQKLGQVSKNKFHITPFPKTHRSVLDAGRMARNKHIMHVLMEVDVTKAII